MGMARSRYQQPGDNGYGGADAEGRGACPCCESDPLRQRNANDLADHEYQG